MPKRVLQGVVVSDKTDKTIVVKVERRFTHPVLKKTVRRSKNYHAHDENNSAKTGQIVQIQESRPFSKTKTWKLVQAEGTASGGGIVDTVTEAVGNVVNRAKAAVGLG
ncbi:MAG: ribosomal protein [Enterovirga sp.]|jgi:small subunit ribosomal protein S17|nr:ribosomal protein [Enterovirga sp.]